MMNFLYESECPILATTGFVSTAFRCPSSRVWREKSPALASLAPNQSKRPFMMTRGGNFYQPRIAILCSCVAQYEK